MVIRDEPPVDSRLLQQKFAQAVRLIGKRDAEIAALSKERDEAIAGRDAAREENEKLLLILSQYKRAIFGRRSEKIDPEQLQLLLSQSEQPDIEAANENDAENTDGSASDKRSAPAMASRPHRNRGCLPAHLSRIDVVIDVEDKACPCCGGVLHKIGEARKEMFDIVPIQFRVKRIIRPRYGCRACESAVV